VQHYLTAGFLLPRYMPRSASGGSAHTPRSRKKWVPLCPLG